MNSNKTILWITENYPPQRGGMSQSCDRIIDGLRKRGFYIEILHFTNRGRNTKRQKQINGYYNAITFEDNEAHTLNVAWNHISTLGNFDFIVCFGGYISMTGAPIFACWMDTPLITFLRGNDFDTAIFSPKKRDMLQYALNQSKIVFSVSSSKKERIKKWINHDGVAYVPNGIDISNWAPSISEIEFAQNWRKQLPNNQICIGIFGQLKSKKGVSFFLESMPKGNLIDKVHLFLIGEVDENIEEKLNELAISHTTMPFQDRYELLKFYLCCDALAIPSYYDGMPNVMLEAGALGIPMLASEVDGMADMLENGKDSILFQPGQEESCRRAIYDLVNMSAKEVGQMGLHLKQKILKNIL